MEEKAPFKLVIDCNLWYRGWEEDSKLIRKEDGKKCCLGFLGQQCGIPDKDLIDQPKPSDVLNNWTRKKSDLVCNNEIFGRLVREDEDHGIYNDNKICKKLMDINDNNYFKDSERIERLKAGFLELNIEATFINVPEDVTT